MKGGGFALLFNNSLYKQRLAIPEERFPLPDTFPSKGKGEGHRLAPIANHRKDKTLLLVLYKEEDPAIPVPECICLERM